MEKSLTVPVFTIGAFKPVKIKARISCFGFFSICYLICLSSYFFMISRILYPEDEEFEISLYKKERYYIAVLWSECLYSPKIHMLKS